MGIFDSWGFDQSTGNNDPLGGLLALSKKDKSGALGQALFQAGMGILSAKTGGNIGAAIGQGGMQGVQAYGSAIDDLKREKLQGYQIQHQQQREATQDERQAKSDSMAETNFNNQQTQFQQSQAKTQAMQELAKKHLKPDGSFDQNGYVAELYQYDPKEAMDYREKMDLAASRKEQAAQGNRPYYTPLQTADGIYSFNSRSGEAMPINTAQNRPAIDPRYDKNLQRDLSANKGYGAESGKIIAEHEAAAPAEMTAANQIVANIDKIANNPNLGAATGLSGVIRPDAYVPGTAIFDLKKQNDQLVSQSFLQARQMLKGGGAITDFEGKKAEAAVAMLNTAQSEEQYRAALKDFRDAVVAGQEKILARQQKGASFGGNAPQVPAGNQPPQRVFKVLR